MQLRCCSTARNKLFLYGLGRMMFQIHSGIFQYAADVFYHTYTGDAKIAMGYDTWFFCDAGN